MINVIIKVIIVINVVVCLHTTKKNKFFLDGPYLDNWTFASKYAIKTIFDHFDPIVKINFTFTF